jgi:hypothetical protein
MNTHRHSTSCPACGHRFIGWRVWQITRWSCMRCPRCEVRLARRFDRQSFMVGYLIMVLLTPLILIPMPLFWQVVWAAAAMTVGLYVDAVTVRLVEVRGWRGMLGYDA